MGRTFLVLASEADEPLAAQDGDAEREIAMTDTSMVEKVARAIGEVYDGVADPVETPNNWTRALAAARAAIAAHRPTIGNGYRLLRRVSDETGIPMSQVDLIICQYIDAILREPTP